MYNALIYSVAPQTGNTSFVFSTPSGHYEVSTNEPIFTATNFNLFFNASLNVFNSTSISAGLITNKFSSESDFEKIIIKYNQNLFDNFQYLVSLNHSFSKNTAAYALFKSQSTRNELILDAKYNGEDILYDPVYFSIPGNIAYGLQQTILERIKLSLEMSHQFIEISEVEENKYYTTKIEESIWNNEITAGINLQILDNLAAGLAYSYYLRYDNEVYRWLPYIDEYEVNFKNPKTILLAVKYSYMGYDLTLHAQHSRSEYLRSIFGAYEIETQSVNYSSTFLKLILTAHLF